MNPVDVVTLPPAHAAARAETRPAPRWLLHGVVVMMALSFFVHMEPAPFDMLAAALLVGGVVVGLRAGREWVPAGACLAVLMAAGVVSLAFTHSTLLGLGMAYHLKTAYLMGVFLLVAFTVHTFGGRAAQLILAAHVVGGLCSVVAVAAGVAGLLPAEIILRMGRASGFFKDPNVLGPYMAIGALYMLHQALERQRTTHRIGAALLFCLLAGTLVASLSRAAWLNFALACAAYGLALLASSTSARQALLRLRRLTVVAVAGALVAIYFAVHVLAMVDIVSRLGLQAYDSQRFDTWTRAAEAGLSNPLGVGPGQSEPVFQYAAHSLYARLLAEQGPIGLGAMVAFLLMSLGRAARLSRRGVPYAPVVFGLLVGLVVNSIFVDTLHWRHLWVVAALAWADP
jgi:hypothetical protein